MADPKLIALYDEAAPIACTISDAEIPERVELFERMRSAVAAVERTPAALVLRFPADPTVRVDLEMLAVDEKRCCQFWGFEITDEPDALVLRWEGPPAAAALVDQLEIYFTSDAPISILEGLL